MSPCSTPDRLSGPSLQRDSLSSMRIKTSSELPNLQVMQSLGTGSMSPEGSVTFCPSPTKKNQFNEEISEPLSKSPSERTLSDSDLPSFRRSESSFLRVSDLDLESDQTSCSSATTEESFPNFQHASSNPPPGVEIDERERWVALNDGLGSFSPIAPLAVERLGEVGLGATLDASMWNADLKTKVLLRKAQASDWMKNTFSSGAVTVETNNGKDVLVWSGTFNHDFYGSELPAIRVAGIIDMSAKNLVDLLVDSSRVKEYNKLSLGREDLAVFQSSMHQNGPFGRSVTKLLKSVSKPPMIRKHMVLVSVFHAKELDDGSGYVVVTRAVHEPESESSSNVIKSEILMGVNLIKKIKGSEDSQCLMINVTHIRSPMVPMVIAKKIGVTAAIGFVNDIRCAC